jgi:hypothetical protein
MRPVPIPGSYLVVVVAALIVPPCPDNATENRKSAGERFCGKTAPFVMLNEVKHLGNEGNRRLSACSAQILRCAQDDTPAAQGSYAASGGLTDVNRPVEEYLMSFDEQLR